MTEPAKPSKADSPSSLGVTWRDSTSPEDSGRYVTSGFPALSTDGTTVMLAVQGSDDARGTPHLKLVAMDLHGVVVDEFTLPKLHADARLPDEAGLQKATEFLRASQAKHGWRPLEWHKVSLRDDGGDGKHASIDGFELALGSSETKVRLSKSGVVLVDNIDLEQAAPHGSCGGRPHVSAIAIDDRHSVAVIEATLVTRDGCFPDPVFSIHSWAKSRVPDRDAH